MTLQQRPLCSLKRSWEVSASEGKQKDVKTERKMFLRLLEICLIFWNPHYIILQYITQFPQLCIHTLLHN